MEELKSFDGRDTIPTECSYCGNAAESPLYVEGVDTKRTVCADCVIKALDSLLHNERSRW